MIIKYNNIGNFAVVLFIFAYILRFSKYGGEVIFMALWLASFVFSVIFFLNKTIYRKDKFIIFSSFAIFLIAGLLYGEIFKITQGLISLANIFLGLLLSRLILNKNYALVVCYSLLAFYFFNIFQGVHPNEIYQVSRNFISVTLIFSLCFYLLAKESTDVKFSLLLALVVLLTCIWAIGRSGIIASFVLFIGISLTKKIKFVFILGGVLLLYLLNYPFDLDGMFYGLFRFGERWDITDVRMDVNGEYYDIATSSVGALIFGADINLSPSIVNLDGNPHNSFIKLHYIYGIFGLLLFAMLNLIVMVSLFIRLKYISILVLFVILIRSTTDVTLFGGPLDLLLFIIIFREFEFLKGKLFLKKLSGGFK